MDANFVLKDTEKSKLKILETLLSQTNHEMKDTRIVSVIGVSLFRLQKMIEELSQELDNYFPDSKISFIYQDNYLKVDNLDLCNIRALKAQYAIRSNLFKTLHYSVFQDNLLDLKDFYAKTHISQPNYYRLRKTLGDYISEDNLIKSIPCVIDDFEYLIRRQVSAIYSQYFVNVGDPFENLSEKVEELVQIFEQDNIKFDEDNLGKIKICFAVQLKRIADKHYFQSTKWNLGAESTQLKDKLTTFFAGLSNDDDYSVLSEMWFVLSVVYSQIRLVNHNEFSTYLKANPKLLDDIEKIENYLSMQLQKNGVKDDELESKLYYMQRLNDWLLIFDLDYFEGVNEDDRQYIFSKYPFRAKIAQKYVDKIIKILDFDLTDAAVGYLKYNYLLGLISVIKNEHVDKSIVVTLNFTKNFAYYDFVSTIIKRYPSTIVSTQFSEDTDLLVTDSYAPSSSSIPQLIWDGVPSREDLLNLENVISEIQLEKL